MPLPIQTIMAQLAQLPTVSARREFVRTLVRQDELDLTRPMDGDAWSALAARHGAHRTDLPNSLVWNDFQTISLNPNEES